MKKIKEISGWLIALLVILASCHTERQTQRIVGKALGNQDAFNTVGMYWQGLHPCANDSTSKTDSIFIKGEDVVKTDTLIRHDTVFITRTIHKTDTLKQKVTNTVVDTRAVQQAKDSATKYKALYEASQHELASITELNQKQVELLKAEHAKAMKAEKKKTHKANWRFIWACIGIGVLVFKKPLLSLATGGWSKLLGIFK